MISSFSRLISSLSFLVFFSSSSVEAINIKYGLTRALSNRSLISASLIIQTTYSLELKWWTTKSKTSAVKIRSAKSVKSNNLLKSIKNQTHLREKWHLISSWFRESIKLKSTMPNFFRLNNCRLLLGQAHRIYGIWNMPYFRIYNLFQWLLFTTTAPADWTVNKSCLCHVWMLLSHITHV